jgi:hypothetical protein
MTLVVAWFTVLISRERAPADHAPLGGEATGSNPNAELCVVTRLKRESGRLPEDGEPVTALSRYTRQGLLWVGTLVLAGVLAGCSFSFHGSSETGNGPEKVSRDFFKQIAVDGPAAAYAAAAPQFREQTGPHAWLAIVQEFDLDRFQSVDWTDSRLAPDGVTTVSGTLYTRGSLGSPLRVAVVSTPNDGWKVMALDLKNIGVTRLGEGASDPGISLGTMFVSPEKVANICRGLLAPLPIQYCARPLIMKPGESTRCVGLQGQRLVGVAATITNVGQGPSSDGNLVCSVTD